MTDTVDDLLAALTTAEKCRLVRGGVDPEGNATGYVPGIDRLGIPACSLTDGPMGVRAGDSTAFPASVALAATFDAGLAERFGRALASEARAKGFDGVLAPGLNVIRVPQCGRSFEYFSEDPILTARTAAAVVRGIESMDVLASPKHYVANSQETDRMAASAELDERTLREIYFPGFVAAVEAGAGTVMAAYNRVGGTYATEHRRLLTDLLKRELGFDGVVVSDWWAVRDAERAASAGLDLEMPGVSLLDVLRGPDGPPGGGGGRDEGADGGLLRGVAGVRRRWPVWFPGSLEELLAGVGDASGDGPGLSDLLQASPFARNLPDAVRDGRVSRERLDDMVRRLLGQYERIGLLGDDRSEGSVGGTRPAGELGTDAHRDLAREIAVRGSVLLKNDDCLPLADAHDTVAVLGPNADAAKVGGGGSAAVTPLETVSPLSAIHDRVGDSVSVTFERGVRLPRPDHSPRERVRCRFGHALGDPFERAVGTAAAADVAVVVVEDHASEGRDRPDLALPGEQDRLVRAVAGTGTDTVVVCKTSGPVEMPWLDAVDAVLQAWYPGQEAGDAVADVLFGDRDPGGRIPVTFGRAAGDYPANTRAQYPGVRGRAGYPEAEYREGVFVGYRGFDAAGTDPLFPFGHGRSFAEFAYRECTVTEADTVELRVTVENTGDRRGREVVQAYVEPAGSTLARPPREFAGAGTLRLAPGESGTVTITLADRALRVYDPGAGRWVADPATVDVAVGRSSRDLRLRERVSLSRR